tara:strand:- start:24 stop:836 length:813 start_codon:yes stop_codon:yes gene_type:complete
MTFYLTGFSGQLGSALREVFIQKRQDVILLGRRQPLLHQNETYLEFDLSTPLSEEMISFSDDCIVIHCAYDFNFNGSDSISINLRGTQNLIDCFSKSQNVKFIYFSTPLDLKNLLNTSFYQKDKFSNEQLFNFNRDLILSPSFLVSQNGKSNIFFNFFQRFKMPIPVPSNINNIAPIKVDDFTSMIYTRLIKKDKCGKFLIVGSKEYSFKSFLKNYYQIRSIKLPVFFFRFAVNVLRIFGFYYLSERVFGLLNLPNLDELKKKEDFIEII